MNKPAIAATIKKIKKVCLFGLSGDPPTGESGHVGIVKALIALNVYDEIHILPVFRHTFPVSSKAQKQVFILGT